MGFFSNRAVATVLAIVAVAGSTLVNTKVKLGRDCREVEDGFYSGVTYDGYSHKSIQSQLNGISGAAGGLVSIANNYDIDTAALSAAQDNLDSSLKYGSVSEIYGRYAALNDEVSAIQNELSSKTLSERDASGVNQYASALKGAASVISSSGYNESVRDFIRNTYDVFPADFLGSFTNVEAPQLFE